MKHTEIPDDELLKGFIDKTISEEELLDVFYPGGMPSEPELIGDCFANETSAEQEFGEFLDRFYMQMLELSAEWEYNSNRPRTSEDLDSDEFKYYSFLEQSTCEELKDEIKEVDKSIVSIHSQMERTLSLEHSYLVGYANGILKELLGIRDEVSAFISEEYARENQQKIGDKYGIFELRGMSLDALFRKLARGCGENYDSKIKEESLISRMVYF